MPTTPHPIGIIVRGVDSNLVSGVTVTLTLSNGATTSGTTGVDGKVIIDVANAGSWIVGDTVSVKAYKEYSGTLTQNLVLTSGPQTLTMTLAETSDYSFDMHNTKNLIRQGSIVLTYDGNMVTRANPLPVESSSSDIDLVNNPSTVWSITRGDGQPDYEEVTLANDDVYRRTFTYNSGGILIARSRWVKQ